MKAEELKLNFIRKWTSLLNEEEVVQDLDEYADEVSREVAVEFVFDKYTSRTPIIADGSTAVKARIEKNFIEWKSKQEEQP